jgi:4-hydroxy-3-methylbut-2-enyl diphosphate reductase
MRIESLDDLTPAMLEGKRRVAITAGASTPSQLTRQVIQFVEQLGVKPRFLPPDELSGPADGVQHPEA